MICCHFHKEIRDMLHSILHDANRFAASCHNSSIPPPPRLFESVSVNHFPAVISRFRILLWPSCKLRLFSQQLPQNSSKWPGEWWRATQEHPPVYRENQDQSYRENQNKKIRFLYLFSCNINPQRLQSTAPQFKQQCFLCFLIEGAGSAYPIGRQPAPNPFQTPRIIKHCARTLGPLSSSCCSSPTI